MATKIKPKLATRKTAGPTEPGDFSIDSWGRVYEEGYPSSTLSKYKSLINRNTASGKIGGSGKKTKGKAGYWSQGNRAAAYVREPAQFDRRVTIKMRVRKLSGGANAGRSKNVLKLHMKYLQRDGVGEDGKEAELYSKEGTRYTDKQFVSLSQDDEHHFRMIISPEDGAELNLTQYTQDLMAQMEKDLGTKLEWTAVNHYNTDNPHTHVVIRGIDEHGKVLVIPPDYISHGIRGRASEIATRELGKLQEHEFQTRISHTLTLDQFTYTDRQLIELSKDNRHVVNMLEIAGKRSDYHLHQRLMTRLHHLRDLGLVKERAYGYWEIDAKLEEKLRELKKSIDLKKLVAQHINQPRHAKEFDKQLGKNQPVVIGKLVGKGVADEIFDRGYLIIDGIDGVAHSVSYWITGRKIEAAIGDIVRIEAKTPAPLDTKVDHNLMAYANGKTLVYDPGAHRQYAIENRMVSEANAEGYIDRHLARLRTLEDRGIVDLNERGQYVLPKDMSARHAGYINANTDIDRRNWQLINRLENGDLAALATARAPTFIDRHLVGEKPLELVANHYGQDILNVIEQRKVWLLKQGLATEQNGNIVTRKPMLIELTRMEFTDLGAEFKEKGKTLVGLKSGQIFEGKALRVHELRSGPYLEVLRGDRQSLFVPMRYDYRSMIGKEVEVSRDLAQSKRFIIKLTPDRQQKLFR